jgi:[ribosomal protein S5]-alanine N-acetyltransferase
MSAYSLASFLILIKTEMLITKRLRIVPLAHDQLVLYKNDPKSLAENLGTNFIERQGDPATAADVEEAMEFWLNNTASHPEHFEWFTNWEIILRDENIAIGGIGFAGLPDEEAKSMIGYGLDIRFRGKGIATEALGALIFWGFQNPNLKTIIADTPLHHVASQKVLLKNNFYESHRDQALIHWALNK